MLAFSHTCFIKSVSVNDTPHETVLENVFPDGAGARGHAHQRHNLRLHEQLLKNPEQLAWLAARGLPLEAVTRYRLGWNPGERGKSCLIRPRKSWGLPPVDGKDKDGKPVAKTTFWIPRGLVIPHLATDDPEGPVLRLRIRRPEADRKEFKENTKYYVIPGSGMTSPLKTLVLGFSELEGRIWRTICARFSLPVELPEAVHVADTRMMITEGEFLMAPAPRPWKIRGDRFELREIGLDYPGQFGLPPREAHRRFLERFAELSA